MRGNPHVRFLEGKMAVMSSSYSTSINAPNPGALQNNPTKKTRQGTSKGYPNLVFSLKIKV